MSGLALPVPCPYQPGGETDRQRQGREGSCAVPPPSPLHLRAPPQWLLGFNGDLSGTFFFFFYKVFLLFLRWGHTEGIGLTAN